MNVTHLAAGVGTVSDLGKCVTAAYWGSSGRRFKSCQPDKRISS